MTVIQPLSGFDKVPYKLIGKYDKYKSTNCYDIVNYKNHALTPCGTEKPNVDDTTSANSVARNGTDD